MLALTKRRGDIGLNLRAATVALSISVCSTDAIADVFSDWQVSCQNEDDCRMSQTLNTENSNWLATISLQQSDEAILSVRVPQGVHFPSGIYAKLPNVVPTRLVWLTCDRAACLAAAEVSGSVVASMRQNQEGWLLYRPTPNSRPIEIAFSLMGVSAGLDALAEAKE